MKKIPEHGPCYVCGTTNPCGIGLTWYARDDGSIHTEFTLSERQQGPPGHAHGGASAAILDEGMGVAVWRAGFNVAVVDLEIRYRRPLPLNTKLTMEAHFTERDERRIYAAGEILLPDGTVAVRGRGVYVEAPHLFEDGRYRDLMDEGEG
ncbi:MAG: PaaI family thioesterase [Chloroflexi bacterium]|nr:PaaI family thioesterase [Chloroflexota bacterium]